MASKTQIANRALSMLGEGRVSNIDTTDTKPARVIANNYDSVRDALLSVVPWNFAVKRTSLAPDGTAPSWGWTYSYTPPSDFLSLYRIRYTPKYEFENGKILTDEGSTLYIQYIAKITNTGSYSPAFNEALSARLAYEACEELTQSNTKKAELLQSYQLKFDEAARIDALENQVEYQEQDDWVTAREFDFTGLRDIETS